MAWWDPSCASGMLTRNCGRIVFISSESGLTFIAENRPSSILRRLATVAEVDNMVGYVCSPQASATTGRVAACRWWGRAIHRLIPRWGATSETRCECWRQWNTARHAGLRFDRRNFRQATISLMSGMTCQHRRNTSGVQAERWASLLDSVATWIGASEGFGVASSRAAATAVVSTITGIRTAERSSMAYLHPLPRL
jgi:hypothetical protein